MDTIICTSCKQFKLITEFYASPKEKRGYRYNCKSCSSSKYKKYLQGDEALQKRRERDKKNKQVLRNRAKQTPPDEQKCYCCGQTKEIAEFGKDSTTLHGVSNNCKNCNNEKLKIYLSNLSDDETNKIKLRNLRYSLKYNFNMSLEEYDILLKAQNYKCAICKTAKSGGNGKRLHVDHCHKTGQVRGLLCNNCNTSLGGFKDNAQYLKNAIEYLENKAAGGIPDILVIETRDYL